MAFGKASVMNHLPSSSITHTSSRICWSFHTSYRVPSACLVAPVVARIPLKQKLHRDRTALPYHRGRRLAESYT